MEDKVNACGNIKNVGFLSGEELYATISKARFTVFPSECYENCPFTVMESQICGTPVIGSNLGGIPELLTENITGLLFESGNAQELKNKIENLWEDKRKQEELTKGCSSVNFDNLKEYTEKILQVYKNC